MVMGPPHTYESVREESAQYPFDDGEGHGLPWWKEYLPSKGFDIRFEALRDRRGFSDFADLPERTRALLVFQIPFSNTGHIVAIDRHGVIDPIDRPASYQSLRDFAEIFRLEGWRLYFPGYYLIRTT